MEQINNLMAKAAKQRAVGCTDMNSAVVAVALRLCPLPQGHQQQALD